MLKKLFDGAKNVTKGMKDTALSQGARLAINKQIREHGEMLRFNLDSKKKTIDAEKILKVAA